MSIANHGTCQECGRPSKWRLTRGRCNTCYTRLRRRVGGFGRPRGERDPRPAVERFLAQIDYTTPSGCWLWTGSLSGAGYGQFGARWAHRYAYETFVGPIPPRMQIDHVRAKGCRHRHCVNWIEHLEVVTPQENALRSPITIASRWAARTHCEYGHEFNDANTAWSRRRDNPEKTYRRCRQCHRIRNANRKAAAR